MHAQLFSHVQLFEIPWSVAYQVPLPVEFTSQEYWSGLLFPSRGDLPSLGIKPTSLAPPVLAGGFFNHTHIQKGHKITVNVWQLSFFLCFPPFYLSLN